MALTDQEWFNHPFEVVERILQVEYDIEAFHFHIYRYIYGKSAFPDRFIDRNELWPVEMMTRRHIERRLERLAGPIPELKSPGENLALCSTVLAKSGRVWHIPQVDFSILEPNDNVFALVNKAAQDLFQTNVMIYSSGHSFHGYVPHLTTASGWYQWISRLLLISGPQQIPAVDVRWIGHQMRSQRSTLRWSYNDKAQYLGYPQRYKDKFDAI